MYHSDIIGEWKITRYIKDKFCQKKFELLGSATFKDIDGLYHYNESNYEGTIQQHSML